MMDKIEGRNPVSEAVKAGRNIDKIYVRRGNIHGSIIPIILRRKRVKSPSL